MNIGLKQISMSLLFVIGMADAAASPFAIWRDVREGPRAYPQRVAVDRGDQRNDPQMQGQGERRGRDLGVPDSSGYGNQGDNSPNNVHDNSKRQGRMTPEERRALRRQIDEAGHDIYRPKR